MSEESSQPARNQSRRSSSALGVFAVVTMVGFGALVISYPVWHGRQRSLNGSGFNVARAPSSATESWVPPPGTAPATPFSVRGPAVPLLPPPAPMTAGNGSAGSSLGMIRAQPTRDSTFLSPARRFGEAKFKSEGLYRDITYKHAAQSAVVREYLKDKNGDPQLAGFWEDYNQDHDYVRYLHRMLGSPSFMKLAVKYGAQPDMWAYAMDMVTSSPKDVTDSWNNYAANNNDEAKELTVNILHAAGLPVSLAESISNGKMDPAQAASQIMSVAPGLSGGTNLQQLLQQQQSGGQ
jgi:hypothetical protein